MHYMFQWVMKLRCIDSPIYIIQVYIVKTKLEAKVGVAATKGTMQSIVIIAQY